MKPPERTLALARKAMAALDKDGCPVVAPETAEEMIDIAWRRWQSIERRHQKGRRSFGDRVEDLAKGLRDAFEQEPSLTGPLMDDYRHAAATLGRVFEDRPHT